MSAHIVSHLMAETGAGIKHGKEKTFDGKGRIKPFFHKGKGVQKTLDSFKGIVFALYRDKERIRRGQVHSG